MSSSLALHDPTADTQSLSLSLPPFTLSVSLHFICLYLPFLSPAASSPSLLFLQFSLSIYLHFICLTVCVGICVRSQVSHNTSSLRFFLQLALSNGSPAVDGGTAADGKEGDAGGSVPRGKGGGDACRRHLSRRPSFHAQNFPPSPAR